VVEDIAPRNATQLLRDLLAEQGEAGRWLLGRIDVALEAGIEDILQVGQLAWHESPDDRRGTELVFRAPRDHWEILDLHLAVIEDYTVALPSCVDSALRDLEHRGGSDAALALRSDRVNDDLLGRDPGRLPLAALASPGWQERRGALQAIRDLVRTAHSQGGR